MNPLSSTMSLIRRYDIDWLKIFALYLVFAFQVVPVLNAGVPLGADKAVFPTGFSYTGFFISQVYVPFVFLISGWTRRNAMHQISGMPLVRERLRRLAVPFVTGFVLVFSFLAYGDLITGLPIGAQKYLGPGTSGLMTAFSRLPDVFNHPNTLSWSYLLFLPYLFLFTLLSWPLFVWLAQRKVTPLKTGRMWVYLPIVPLILVQMSLVEYRPSENSFYAGLISLLYFFAYFLMGFIISRYSAYERAVHQEAVYASAIGIALLAVIMAFADNLPGQVSLIISPIACWCSVVGVLGFAKKYLDAPSSWLLYLQEAALPVFVFHIVPILIIGSLVRAFSLGKGMKYPVLLLASLGVSMLIYHFIIRRFKVLRFLFGMKEAKEPVETWKDQVFSRDRG